MKYQVDGWNNFCRVFELPEKFPTGFCFGGGHPVNFQLVDWFYPVSQMEIPIPAVSKEVWEKEVGEIESKAISIEELHCSIVPFLRKKIYTKSGRTYLVLCDFGAALQLTV